MLEAVTQRNSGLVSAAVSIQVIADVGEVVAQAGAGYRIVRVPVDRDH